MTATLKSMPFFRRSLDDFDLDALIAVFLNKPILKYSDIGKSAETDRFVSEQLASLFDRFQINTMVMVSSSPFRLYGLNMPALASNPSAELELAVLQRFATLLPDATVSND